MNRQLVLVKDIEGKPLLRRVVSATETVVFVASDEGLERIDAGASDLYPIGFRRECVFEYEGDSIPKKPQWNRMKIWTPKS